MVQHSDWDRGGSIKPQRFFFSPKCPLEARLLLTAETDEGRKTGKVIDIGLAPNHAIHSALSGGDPPLWPTVWSFRHTNTETGMTPCSECPEMPSFGTRGRVRQLACGPGPVCTSPNAVLGGEGPEVAILGLQVPQFTPHSPQLGQQWTRAGPQDSVSTPKNRHPEPLGRELGRTLLDN